MSKKNKCENVKILLEIEKNIIKRHINRHKWFNGIKNENEAICDFVKKYAWLMKEVFCESCCSKKDQCSLLKDVIKRNQKP